MISLYIYIYIYYIYIYIGLTLADYVFGNQAQSLLACQPPENAREAAPFVQAAARLTLMNSRLFMNRCPLEVERDEMKRNEINRGCFMKSVCFMFIKSAEIRSLIYNIYTYIHVIYIYAFLCGSFYLCVCIYIDRSPSPTLYVYTFTHTYIRI